MFQCSMPTKTQFNGNSILGNSYFQVKSHDGDSPVCPSVLTRRLILSLPVSMCVFPPGFLVPAVGVGAGVRGHCVVVLLEGLEKASSLTGLLGDLCHSLDNRGPASLLPLNTGTD